MAKPGKEETFKEIEEALAFDMIELTSEGLQDLARAFEVIDTVCKELQGLPLVNLDSEEVVH